MLVLYNSKASDNLTLHWFSQATFEFLFQAHNVRLLTTPLLHCHNMQHINIANHLWRGAVETYVLRTRPLPPCTASDLPWRTFKKFSTVTESPWNYQIEQVFRTMEIVMICLIVDGQALVHIWTGGRVEQLTRKWIPQMGTLTKLLLKNSYY